MMSRNPRRNLFEERALERSDFGELGGPKWSTPKREDEHVAPEFDEISVINPYTSFIAASEKNSSRKDVITVARNRCVIYFGFVAVGETHVVQHKIINKSDEQLRFKCSLDSKSLYFKIMHSESLIVQPREEGVVTVSYTPTNLDLNNNLLHMEKLNGAYKKFTFRIIGYGGRAKVQMSDLHFKHGLAEISPSGAIVFRPDFFPPPPSVINPMFTFELMNKGDRRAFVRVRAVNRRGEELSETSVRIHPSRCIIDRQNKSQKLTVRISRYFNQNRRESSISTVSNAPPTTDRNCSILLQVMWGEETQRQRFKLWQSNRPEIFIISGENFSESYGEDGRTAKDISRLDPFEHENEEFKNSLRIFDINIIDNRLSSLYNLDF